VLMIVEWQFGIPLDAMTGGSWGLCKEISRSAHCVGWMHG
jgi:hypothetical protein